MAIDETGDRRHALAVDDLQARRGGRPRGNRGNVAALDDNRALLDDLAGADDDADVRDDDILGGERPANARACRNASASSLFIGESLPSPGEDRQEAVRLDPECGHTCRHHVSHPCAVRRGRERGLVSRKSVEPLCLAHSAREGMSVATIWGEDIVSGPAWSRVRTCTATPMAVGGITLWHVTNARAQGGVIYGCASPGRVRIVEAGESCRPQETRVTWAPPPAAQSIVIGPEGPPGPPGPMGPQGPAGPRALKGRSDRKAQLVRKVLRVCRVCKALLEQMVRLDRRGRPVPPVPQERLARPVLLGPPDRPDPQAPWALRALPAPLERPARKVPPGLPGLQEPTVFRGCRAQPAPRGSPGQQVPRGQAPRSSARRTGSPTRQAWSTSGQATRRFQGADSPEPPPDTPC